MNDAAAALASALPVIERASRSNRRLAEQILAEGQVVLTCTKDAINARVTGPPGTSRRTVIFTGAGNDLSWRCTCTRETTPLCKHVVAALLDARAGR